MSSAAGGGPGAPSRYFCHQCNRTILIQLSSSGDLSCPICHGGFIEEFNLPSPPQFPNPNPNPPSAFSLNPSATPFFPSAFSSPLFLSRSTSFDLRNSTDLFSLINPDSAPFASSSTTSFNPVDFLQRYIQTLLNDGANIQIVVEGGGDRRIGNLGDYFIGPGLEQLIEQLAENDPNRHGTPPAAKAVVAALPDVVITDNLLAADDQQQCAVCKEFFEIGEVGKQMPCNHIFHKDCIIPWLELHNSCPVCRFELPTDDLEYEQRNTDEWDGWTGAAEGAGNLGVGAGVVESEAQNLAGQRTNGSERRFRISLPWPFRGFGSQPDGNSGGDAGGGGASGGNDETSGGRGGSGTDIG